MGEAKETVVISENAHPKLIRREKNVSVKEEAAKAGLPGVVSRVLAGRLSSVSGDVRVFLNGSLTELDHPEFLADMEKAASRIADAVANGETIGLESDYDQDGMGAMAVFWKSFTEEFGHPEEKLQKYIGHRLIDGYGLSKTLAQRMLENSVVPSVVITADNGSSDEKQIKTLKDAGVDVIVTDHHEIPKKGPPASAYACINPQRHDCEFPDKNIAGGMVAWLLMCSVRRALVERDLVSREGSRMGALLDYVACSTVADCVSMASKNNRAVVKHGLRLMNRRERACWAGIDRLLNGREITAETIAFGIAPRVNAQTRMSSADDAINFLLAETKVEAERLAERLDGHNKTRKEVESKMVADAISLVEATRTPEKLSICILLEDGHPGVQGICSSRLVERFGMPAFTFCKNAEDPTIATGSGRSDRFVPLKDCLELVEKEQPGLMVKFGGHAAAAGVTLDASRIEEFTKGFERAVSHFTSKEKLGAFVVSDGQLEAAEISLDTLEELSILEPTGRGFESAQFDGEFLVTAVKPVGDGTHLQLALGKEFRHFKGIWFKARQSNQEELPVSPGETAQFVYRLADNNGYGPRRLQIQVVARIG